MRMAIGALSDFVPGRFAVPGNYGGKSGIGDFVPGRFSVPGYYGGANGLGRLSAGCGCGSKCGCGPCSGMGAIDFSPSAPGITAALGTQFGTTLPAVPNWIIYAGAIAIAYGMYSSGSGARGRRR